MKVDKIIVLTQLNGRISRALTEMMLSKIDATAFRFYTMSNQVLLHRKDYYDILEKTQHRDLDVTDWVLWFSEAKKKGIDITYTDLENFYGKLFL